MGSIAQRAAAGRGRQHGSAERRRHRGGSGNFAEDRQRASEAGRKGGQR
ncbi:KGG domain-containing protein [Mesorhizobium sp. RIZ17]